MRVTHCYVCNRPSGFARRLGWGTFFMVILTAGFWLLVIPFYPKRCTTCGCTEGGAARASLALAAGPPSRERQLMTAYGTIGVFVLVVLLIWLANLEPSKTVPLAPAPTQTVSNDVETTESAASAPPLRGKLRLTVDESLDSPRFLGLAGWQRMANAYVVPTNPNNPTRLPRLELLCPVPRALTCFALRAGETYGADVVQSGEPDYSECPRVFPGYACVRVYDSNHTALYAAGESHSAGIPTLDEEAASLPPVEETAEVPRYAQPVQAEVPPVQSAPSTQATVEPPATPSEAGVQVPRYGGKPGFQAPSALAEAPRSEVMMVTVTKTKVVQHIDQMGHAMLLARAYRKDTPDDRFSLICHTGKSSCTSLREGEEYNATILYAGDPSYESAYGSLKGAVIVRIGNGVFALMREKR